MYKYEMIAEEIQKKIKDGTYPPDTRLPQEMEMCKIYDASRITIREAMELLVAKGLITKRRGAGTFVKAVAPGMTDQVGFSKSGQFSGFSKDQAGRKVSSDVHEFGLKKCFCLLYMPYQIGGWETLCSRIHLHAYGFYYRYYGRCSKKFYLFLFGK